MGSSPFPSSSDPEEGRELAKWGETVNELPIPPKLIELTEKYGQRNVENTAIYIEGLCDARGLFIDVRGADPDKIEQILDIALGTKQ